MPRWTNTGDEVAKWAEETDLCPTDFDLCGRCRPDDLVPEQRDEPTGKWEMGAEHPPYDDQHPPYTCVVCGCPLGAADD